MCKNIEQDGKTDLDRNVALFNKLTHRGPTAFEKIVAILKELEYKDAHKLLTETTVPAEFAHKLFRDSEKRNGNGSTSSLLSGTSNGASNSNENLPISNGTSIDGGCSSKQENSKLVTFKDPTSFQFANGVEVKRASKFGSHSKLQVFRMTSKKRGVFFFVNIINFKDPSKKRVAAEMDKENLITLFREMNYSVFYYENLTREEFFELISLLKQSDYLKEADSFVFCMQTHGDMLHNHTLMEFTDGSMTDIEKILALFANTKCKDLINKPKVFFFPFCRGQYSDRETQIRDIVETDGAAAVATFSDILICYGTLPSFAAHRNTKYGSWYVTELCRIFVDHACDEHIEDMLKMVGAKVMQMKDEGKVQVPSTEGRGFNKLMFFNPKISD